MRRILHHFVNELRLHLYRARRYLFETLFGFALLGLLFGGLLWAVSSISGQRLGSGALDGLLLGFVLWYFATSAFGCAGMEIAEEMRQRTLEPLCVAPLPLGGLLLLRTLLRLVGGLVSLLLLITLLRWLTDGRLQLQTLQALGPVLLAAPALIGLGFASAGLLLVVKRAEALPALLGLALMALVALPAYPANAYALLPYALGAAGAKAAASGATLHPGTLVWIALNSAIYLGLGLLLFAWAKRNARRLGILGHG
jgi:ABC-2 type transport system permease protein